MTAVASELATRLGADLLRARLLRAPVPVLDGKYQLLHVLGRGSSGLVVRALDTRLQRRVAIKMAPASTHGSGVRHEAQALARLSRPPNVVQVHDLGTGAVVTPTFTLPVDYLAMELIEGPTLRSWVLSTRRSQRDVLAMYCAVANGIATLHGANIVHADVKPDNVLVAPDGAPYLVDLGFAINVMHAPGGFRKTQIRGTPGYMAPECHQAVAGKPSDVYAFAAAVWESASGKLPGQPSNAGPFEWWDRFWRGSGLSAPLEAVLRPALDPDPHRRPTIQTLQRQLLALCA